MDEKEVEILLPARLRFLRKLYGMSQKDIAAYLNMDRSSYTYYENGKTEPDLHTLYRIAALYHVSTDFLLGKKTNAFLEDSIQHSFFEESRLEELLAIWPIQDRKTCKP